VGDPSHWDAALKSSLEYAGVNGGAVVFVGGGGFVSRAIERIRQSPELRKLQVVLVTNDSEDGGASSIAARDGSRELSHPSDGEEGRARRPFALHHPAG
jgi:hypothetical protein